MKEFFEKTFRNKDNKLCIDFNELNEVCKLNEIPYVKGETNIDFGDDAFANIQCDEIGKTFGKISSSLIGGYVKELFKDPDSLNK